MRCCISPALGLLVVMTTLTAAEEPSAPSISPRLKAAAARDIFYVSPVTAAAGDPAKAAEPPALTMPAVHVQERPGRLHRELEEAITQHKQFDSRALFKNDQTKKVRVEGVLPPILRINPAGEVRIELTILRIAW